ncbi:hypothetical protein CspHIS471_0212800 [Cutaneotrichosporon sp. HIS471]|nr:hypothetical protein CspHIS471_0212800 [Cutaneotrichosporon sp. HIS471]
MAKRSADGQGDADSIGEWSVEPHHTNALPPPSLSNNAMIDLGFTRRPDNIEHDAWIMFQQDVYVFVQKQKNGALDSCLSR